jgi:ABC-type transport system involved in multi-copper enzyme maturation permease subunit
MITTTAADTPAGQTAPGRMTRSTDLIASEWRKLFSTRSTYWALVIAAVVCVVVAVLIANSYLAGWKDLSAAQQAAFDPQVVAFTGFDFGQFVLGALGSLAMTSEYAYGLVRSTFAAVPQRGCVLAAKAATLTLVALPTGLVLATVALFSVQAVLHGHNAGVALEGGNAVRAIAAMGLYSAAIALLGLALGALVRHTAGAMIALVGLVYLLPQIVAAFPAPWDSRIGRFLPGNGLIGHLTAMPAHAAGGLSPLWSVVLLIAYPVVFLSLARNRLLRRDA